MVAGGQGGWWWNSSPYEKVVVGLKVVHDAFTLSQYKDVL